MRKPPAVSWSTSARCGGMCGANETTGSLAPTTFLPGPQPAIGSEQEAVLLTQLRAHPDATLEEHCAIWQQEQERR